MLDGQVEQLARGRVDPMRVLEDHHHRLLARQTFELPDQRLQNPFLLALWTEVRQRVTDRTQRHEIGEECHILLARGSASWSKNSWRGPGHRFAIRFR